MPKPTPQTNNESIVPRHLGLILDGNRRWALENGFPKLEGHRYGYETLKTIADAALDRGVKYLTAYVFSTENWKRPPIEVKFLMDLLYWVATKEVEEFHQKNIRLVFLGKEVPLSPKILKAIYQAEEKTKHNSHGTLALCLNYGGQTEITEAVQKIIKAGIHPDQITPDTIQAHLYHPEIPDVDFIIRTSGEQRLSNFMLWRSAYAELYFKSNKHWPAFTVSDLDEALKDYAERVRRFGI
ncbi:MAG TPA: polyprenyl diphosphate synthase [Candidatus Saccharimonadales bacterium]|nr:polyprenyl diphosphate synthase [Candidatus Saccharimonadales bacterium]